MFIQRESYLLAAIRRSLSRAGLCWVLLVSLAAFAAPARGQNFVTTIGSIGGAPHGIGVNPVTNKIYVADDGGSLIVIDGATNAKSTASNLSATWEVAIDPSTNTVYGLDRTSKQVYIWTGATASSGPVLTATVSLSGAGNPFGITVNPANGKVYVCDDGGSTVYVIDTHNGNSVTPVPVDTAALEVVVNPATGYAYALSGYRFRGCDFSHKHGCSAHSGSRKLANSRSKPGNELDLCDWWRKSRNSDCNLRCHEYIGAVLSANFAEHDQSGGNRGESVYQPDLYREQRQ